MTELKRMDLKNILNIGFPSEPEPTIPLYVYERRLKRLREMMEQNDISSVIIYGDREHFANIMYFTGYDPRFEEALLIVNTNDLDIILVVGNEGLGYSNVSSVPHQKILFSTFSLAGQPGNSTADLKSILKNYISYNQKIGLVGWKPVNLSHTEGTPLFAVPHFIVQAISELLTNNGLIDVTDFMMDPQYGLRSHFEIEQLARFEWVATCSSESVFRALLAMKPGQSEYEIASNLPLNGYPHAHHLCVTSGERLDHCFGSPSSRRVQIGEPLLLALGLRGSNTCRAGFLVHDKTELPDNIRDYDKKVAIPYFKAIGGWYQNFRINAKVCELHKAVHNELTKPFFNIGLNAGHQIDNEEWMNSPVTESSVVELKSGNYYQCDFFPSALNGYYGIFAEDSVALLDSATQQDFAQRYPAAFSRIQLRKTNMINILNIKVSEDILPFSNICGFVFPYLYDLNSFPSF